MRQILKTSTYAVMHFVVAVGVAYALTQNWQLALGIGLIEPLVQTVAYTFHERLWERVPVLGNKFNRDRWAIFNQLNTVTKGRLLLKHSTASSNIS